MPLIVDGGRVPPHWLERQSSCLAAPVNGQAGCEQFIRVAFINNMPDAALEDTELQFFELLDASSDDLPLLLKLYSLTGVPRGDRGQPHLNKFYSDINDLWDSQFDAVIITGTEPHHPDLRNEPYWPSLVKLLDWAEQNTVSAVLSCLAAHASVLHSDGIGRHRLSDKQFGVFDFHKVCEHPLTRGTAELVRFPHSRWNEVRADALTSCGYVVLAQAADAGVDSFVKMKKRSLFVHFQGHPEYGPQTLLKEYRRDIKRFIRGERETYPSTPKGYFDAAATKALAEFRDAVVSDPREESMAAFPGTTIDVALHSAWYSTATCIYRNWLKYVVSRKAEEVAFPVMAASYGNTQRKRSAMP